MWTSLLRTGVWQGEVWDRRKNGEIYPKWMVITELKSDDGITMHYVSTQTNMTQRKMAEDEIKHLAFYDPLTQLPNRRLLLDRLQQALATSVRNERQCALFFIDLDNFKTLNDTLGHDKGDLLLQQAANRLSGCIGASDTVARLGGDEFVVILELLSSHSVEAAEQAETVGENILDALNQNYCLHGYDYCSTASIGITLFGHRHEAIEELLRQADLAMYQAKAAGRNALRFFDSNMQTAVAARIALEKNLRHAVREQQFVLYYQAQVNGAECITGAEALLRWQHPQRGLVFPDEFIALAEETGLILPLGHCVLETACAQLAAWAGQANVAHLTLAVNVSAQQLCQADFVARVLAVLERTGADPSKLKLELTESVLMDNVEDIIAKMSALKNRGVHFALDDFGTGYSSLAYLKRLPLEKLKIDRSFVNDVLTDPNDAVIAKTIVTLAHSLGLAVIAEGVETEEHRHFLAQHGCHAYQGYLFSRPVPLQAFEALVARVDATPSFAMKEASQLRHA
jgi:diguanylate cyclase (GGDEF)-like protein